MHETNIQKLMSEMFKAKNELEPNLLQGIFEKQEYEGPILLQNLTLILYGMGKDHSKIWEVNCGVRFLKI